MPEPIDPERRKLFHQLARVSAEIIAPLFLSPRLRIDTKPDRTVVTQADRDAEAAMREVIRRAFPDDGVIGEEHGSERANAEFVWVLDPIDGTICFTRGFPQFGTLIGLLHHGRPSIGAMHQPVLSKLLLGDGETTTLNGEPVRVAPCLRLSDALLVTTDLDVIGKHKDAECFDALRSKAGMFRTWGDCYGYFLVATGGAHAACDAFMHPWDVLPLIPVITGAGGVITTWEGEDAATGNSAVAASPGIHAETIRILAEGR